MTFLAIPHYLSDASARCGTMIEFCSAAYDLDDSSASALVFIAEQLNHFTREAKHVLIAAGGRPPAA
ncbi:MAG TPA: hypothetical protein VHC19_16150 [Pirellulales bacterium]|nr:hypothetical protein [Pirellulales bacterium]